MVRPALRSVDNNSPTETDFFGKVGHIHAAFAWFIDDAIVRNSLPDHSRENPSRAM